MTANPYTPDEAQQAANEQAVRDAIALISRPLSWQQQREVDRVVAGAVGLLSWERKLERGHP
jgi:hypothetical protein